MSTQADAVTADEPAAPCVVAGAVPLVALLGGAKDVFVADFERRLAASDFRGLSLAKSANVLRFLGQGPMRASQIVERCGVSKQAVSQQLAQLERDGYVAITSDPTDQRARLVALTEDGEAAQRFVHATFDQVEEQWAQQLGARDAATLRRVLTKVLARHPGC